MKKKLLLSIIAAVLVTCAVTVCVKVSRSNDQFERNVEALSLIEEGAPGTGKCYKRIHSTDTGLVLFCGSCIYVKGEHDWLFPGTDVCN